MLIGVLADTHDHLLRIQQVVRLFQDRGVCTILHAGDYVAPFALKEMLTCGIPFVGVFGNNDGEKDGLRKLCDALHEPPCSCELDGRRITLLHDQGNLSDAVTAGADLIIWGYTHEAQCRDGPPLTLNPGEACGWVHGKPTVAIVDLTDMTAQIVELDTSEGADT